MSDKLRRAWYSFGRNRMSVVGLFVVTVVIILAVFAPYIAPHPAHVGAFVDFRNASRAPSWANLLGTDTVGRDMLSRTVYGFRYSLIMGVVVLFIAVPVGTLLGLLAGYMHGSWLDTIIMRITDVFLALPPLILALAICSVLTPSLFNAMMAVTAMWWPWYCRLVYGQASSLRQETYVAAAEVVGARMPHILFRELLPNCISTVLTKATLDMGIVILIGSALSFVGLGAQPPTPDLGTMVADGAKYLPELWWISVFPAIAIVLTVLGFNLLGDGLRDMFAIEEL